MATATPVEKRGVSSNHSQHVRSVLQRMLESCKRGRFLVADHEFFAGMRDHDSSDQQPVSATALHFTRAQLDYLLALLADAAHGAAYDTAHDAPRFAVEIQRGQRVIETTAAIHSEREAKSLVDSFLNCVAGEGYSARIVPARSM
ncbi:MAG: hypothetical protein K1X71_13650 [Pirellulales bacterium]|nr:hypothetical protein [Pirellulales bacterium]